MRYGTYNAYNVQLVIGSITEIQPRAVIVDSIQTVYLAEANGSAGSVSQVSHQLFFTFEEVTYWYYCNFIFLYC